MLAYLTYLDMRSGCKQITDKGCSSTIFLKSLHTNRQKHKIVQNKIVDASGISQRWSLFVRAMVELILHKIVQTKIVDASWISTKMELICESTIRWFPPETVWFCAEKTIYE